MDLKVAVISDLHCHNKSNNNNVQESYLLTDVNVPDNQNPLKSFTQLINQRKDEGEEMNVDILIMPGDITNKCDQEGYEYAWKIIKEIASLVNAKLIIPTIGNHDVDSRKKYSKDPFERISTFSSDFPFPIPSYNESFWKDGFTFIDGDNYRILIINSAFEHDNVDEAEHGAIKQKSINIIEKRLEQLKATKKRFNIAVCHHHPIPHERHYLGTTDLIFNGTQLVELLGQYDYQMIIHGHKHDPLIRYASGGTNSPVVFSSGSFSAYKNLLLQGAYNTFHIVNFEDASKPDCENQGTINTWFFTPSKGWDLNVNNEYFLPKIGFGCRTSIKQLAQDIYTWFSKQTIDNYDWNMFVTNFEMINYLLPNDKKLLGDYLREFKINVYPRFPKEPEIISFKR